MRRIDGGIASGDVIEIETARGAQTALVLLASGGRVILDLLDFSTPLVFDESELGDYRVFHPDVMAAA